MTPSLLQKAEARTPPLNKRRAVGARLVELRLLSDATVFLFLVIDLMRLDTIGERPASRLLGHGCRHFLAFQSL